jgi:hypothetical protein
MKCMTIRRRRSIVLGAALSAIARPGLANTYQWNTEVGNWTTTTDWNPVGTPGSGDTAYVTATNGTTQVVTYDYTGTNVTLAALYLDLTGGTLGLPGSLTASQLNISAANTFAAITENVGGYVGSGSNGVGCINQSAGDNTIPGQLYLGYNAGDTGTYAFSGTSDLSVAGNVYVGYSGSGIFNQSGSASTVASAENLYVGYNATATGSYTLSGSATLSTTGSEFIGGLGVGSFNQTGGTHMLTSGNNSFLYLGSAPGSTGTYTLSGGSLTIEGYEYLGYNGVGVFNQSGGTNSITGGRQLYLGYNAGSTGTYNLSGTGSLSCSSNEYIGDSFGAGIFNQSGGTNTTPVIYVGYNGPATGTYTLSGGGTLSCSSAEYVGFDGGGTFNQTGGSNTITAGPTGGGVLYLGVNSNSLGEYLLSGGTLTAADIIVGGGSAPGTGILTVSNTGSLSVTGTLMIPAGSQNVVNLDGGTTAVAGLTIGSGATLNVNSHLLITSDDGNASTAEAAIQQYIATGAIVNSDAAANGLVIAYADGSDGIVTRLPAGELIIEPALAGDTDLSGTVDIHDLQNLLSDFNQPGFWDQGNFTGHAVVDISDLQALLTNFNTTTTLNYSKLAGIENLVGQYGFVAGANPSGTGFTLVAIPEPTSAILAAAGIAPAIRRRTRNSHG